MQASVTQQLKLVIIYVTAVMGVVLDSGAEINFSRDVLPVLSDKCYACHGPDTKNDKDLRLDSFEAATIDLGGYKAIDPSNLSESEVITRIFDRDDPMPPDDAEKQLTEAEKNLIKEWVLGGGKYTEHWSFVRPSRPDVNLEADEHANAIDYFVGEKLKSSGVGFAEEADRRVLARRASLVLTGLPPEPSLVDEYVEDDSEGAYEKLVDRLMAEPSFGEHQARYWLDAVRYGDTHGLHLDNRRGIYPYRDWVVRSLNDNLPFDTSIKWQLAGDLLPDPTVDQLLATGFVRMNPTTSEGGAIPAEFQAKNNFDRTETFGTVFLGMTLNCARCHNHKYDPIAQKEYYSLLAFFNSTAESSMDGNSYTYGPTVRVPENLLAWNHWQLIEERQERILRNVIPEQYNFSGALEFAKAYKLPKFSDWKISQEFDEVTLDGEMPDPEWAEAKGFPGSRRELVPDRGKSIYVSFDAESDRDKTLWIEFSSAAGGVAYVNGQKIEISVPSTPDQRSQVLALPIRTGNNLISIRMAGTGLRNQQEIRFLNPWESFEKSGEWASLADHEKIMLIADPVGPLSGLGESVSVLEFAVESMTARANFTTSLVARELDKPRETRVLQRGEYNLPIGDPLSPGILSVAGELPAGASRDRLGLAQWLTSRDQPLVSRVLVNQLWLRIFGDGLVRTPEDFGRQGQQPTHPELLDWLAVEFQESGWDLKHMVRQMVTSRTFRQNSARRADIKDPENRLWSRGPSYRLDAEVLRDTALWASSALDDHMGGEGVKPYQPDGMWLAMAHPASNTKQYLRDYNQRLYRRSLYVYWKRTSPHPMMTLFDAPSRESSCVRRSRTNTPLQSLGLLNETQRVELGRVFAARLIQENSGDQERLNQLFRLMASRLPTSRESQVCLGLLESMKDRYLSDNSSACELVRTGDYRPAVGVDPVEQAAWTQVVMTVLASDIAILLY